MALLLLMAMLSGAGLSACAPKSSGSSANEAMEFFAMDTVVTIRQPSSDGSAERTRITELSNELDCYEEKSALSALNRNGGGTLSDSLSAIMSRTLALEERFGDAVQLSGGAITRLWGVTSDAPHVPTDAERLSALQTVGDDRIGLEGEQLTLPEGMRLDLGAVAKGYALDCLSADWTAAGYAYGVASFQSSTLLFGKKPDQSRFRVMIQDPDGDGYLGTVETDACFLSTSGGYERFFEADGTRYCHMFDLSTGMPTQSDLTSVTVFTDNGLKSDYLSTLIFLEGTAGLSKHLDAADYRIVAADQSGKLYVSPGLDFTESDA